MGFRRNGLVICGPLLQPNPLPASWKSGFSFPPRVGNLASILFPRMGNLASNRYCFIHAHGFMRGRRHSSSRAWTRRSFPAVVRLWRSFPRQRAPNPSKWQSSSTVKGLKNAKKRWSKGASSHENLGSASKCQTEERRLAGDTGSASNVGGSAGIGLAEPGNE